MEQTDAFDETFSSWRQSYLRLRVAERSLVTEARSGKDPVKVAAMYDQVEAMRLATTALFHLTQTASMAHQIPNQRVPEFSGA
jgi:hypothetical protein